MDAHGYGANGVRPKTSSARVGTSRILAVSEDDQRRTWPERELIRQLGRKLYGKRDTKDVRHG